MDQVHRSSAGPGPLRPWLRRIVVTLGPLEEWRGATGGETVRFESNGVPGALRVSGRFRQTIMGLPDPSQVSVYNLAGHTRDAIRGNLTKITVQAGWKTTELHTVFQGSVLSAVSGRNGADVITDISALPGYGALVRGISAQTFVGGTPVRDAVRRLAQDLSGLTVADSSLEGLGEAIGPGGWSFAGNTKDGLTQLANEYGFSWHIDKGVFKAVGDTARFGGMVVLRGDDGGLVSVTPVMDGPTQTRTGVRIQALYVPGVEAGSAVQVESAVSSSLNGTYRVNTCSIAVDTHGDQWTMDIEALQI